MEWSEYPEYFYASSEIARDIADEKTRIKIGSLKEHTLEEHTMATLSTALQSKPYMLQISR